MAMKRFLLVFALVMAIAAPTVNATKTYASFKTKPETITDPLKCAAEAAAVVYVDHTITYSASSSCKLPAKGAVLCAVVAGGLIRTVHTRCNNNKPSTKTGASTFVCDAGYTYYLNAQVMVPTGVHYMNLAVMTCPGQMLHGHV